MPEFRAVCKVDDIPEGEARMFVLGEETIGVFRVDGNFFALANECPHGGASLADGYLDGEIVACRIHHWRFSLRDGKYLDEDRPECDVQTLPVRIVGDELQVAFAAQQG